MVPFDIPIINDTILEGNEKFDIILRGMLPDNVTFGSPHRATVNIINDDGK